MSGALFTDGSKAAALSSCGRYRYTLERRWGPGAYALFLMLNPSTADAQKDDPTIRRCVGFARRWGFDAMIVWNLYAYRATDPVDLDLVENPIGPDNNDYLWTLLQRAGVIVAAWGAKPNRGRYVYREGSIRAALDGREVHCLGLTKGGHPRHPLYVRADAPLVPYDCGPLFPSEPKS